MQLSALDFSTELTQGFAFGIDKERPAATLRRLADMMESGQVLLQTARVTSFASSKDFTLTGLRLVFAEKIDDGPKALYGPASKFPAAVAPTDS
jgi:hypothetical protein